MDQRPEPPQQLKTAREPKGPITIEWQSTVIADEGFDYLCEFFCTGTDRSYGFHCDADKPE